MGDSDDEEITSESEEEDEDVHHKKQNGMGKPMVGDVVSDVEDDDDEGGEDEDMSINENEAVESGKGGSELHQSMDSSSPRAQLKRKLSAENVEETLAKRHADFQSFRWDTVRSVAVILFYLSLMI